MKTRISKIVAVSCFAFLVCPTVAQPADEREERDWRWEDDRRDFEGGPRARRNGQRQGRRGRMRGRERRPGRGDFRPRPHPLMTALDADKDGELSAEEIEKAVAALKTLDKDADGKLSREELRPRFDGRNGAGRPGGANRGRPGGPGRPGGNFAERLMSHDEDGDGKVTKDELPVPMQHLLNQADQDGDGAIDQAEAEEAAREFGGGRGAPPRRRGRGQE